MFHARLTLHPEVGAFPPTSFRELLQHEVAVPGLDPGWRHILVDTTVTPDGSSAELTIRSEPHPAATVGAALRVVGTPPAHVRVCDVDGAELAAGPHPTPLHEGQDIAVGGVHYRVVAASWPNRDPTSGCCSGDLDWQHAVVVAAPRPETVPTG